MATHTHARTHSHTRWGELAREQHTYWLHTQLDEVIEAACKQHTQKQWDEPAREEQVTHNEVSQCEKHACTHACTHARTLARTHARTHAHTHTHTHTEAPAHTSILAIQS